MAGMKQIEKLSIAVSHRRGWMKLTTKSQIEFGQARY